MSYSQWAYFLARATTPRRRYYQIEVRHEQLNKHRLIRGADQYEVEGKAQAQLQLWNDMWDRRQQAEAKRQQAEANKMARAQAAQDKEFKKQLAAARTREAQETLKATQDTLLHGLSRNPAIYWEELKDRAVCPHPKPPRPQPLAEPPEPNQGTPKYAPKSCWLGIFFSSIAQKNIATAEALFRQDHAAWEVESKRVADMNEDGLKDYNIKLEKWEQRRLQWIKEQEDHHLKVDARREKYLSMDTEGILDYCNLVLSKSQYPDWFPHQFDLDYSPTTKLLIVDYFLPSLDNMPTLMEVKYIQAKDEFKESYVSDTNLKQLYDDLLYQISLRTLHELFMADVAKAIDAIVINGLVRTTDKSTGRPTELCILSVQASKEEFTQINLRDVDPKACFRRLKGVGSSKLHGMAAVPPIMCINREDARFVEARAVAHILDESLNIAAMDWLEFEHLIREIFEKIFSSNGGEVKITRASRDHGVDGIAFDPDPIRGGKIVIQAKRYTNPVDVAAVRDLYGTVVNEGAIKGILVTTSEYGPDAYAFAKDKPLTLLNGSNLLHLLQQHGYKAKIDLAEAKKLLST